MPDIVGAFVGREEADGGGDQGADLFKAARTTGAEEGLQFTEGEFDRIEIGTVGREEPQVRPGLLNGRADRWLFVDREVVEHDDIARSQGGHQHLLDVGEETRTVDRAIEHGWRAQTLEAERGDDGVRFPVTAGCVIAEPRATRTPAVPTEEIGRDAAFIEKDVLPHIAERQPLAPAATLSDDIGAALLVGVYRFF